jgi:MFS family permease
MKLSLTHDPAAGAPRRFPLVALLVANTVSMVGSQLTVLAIPWFVLQTTESAPKTGMAGATVAAAYVVTAFVGGSLVDRLGFRWSSVLSDLLGAIAFALVPLLQTTTGLAFWQFLALIFVATSVTTPGGTARQSLLPDLAVLAGATLERVNAIAQAARTGASLGGPLLAGLLISTFGARHVLWVDAATFAFSALVVGLAVPGRRARARTEERARTGLMVGIRFIQRHRLIRNLVLIGAGVNALAGALFAVVLPIVAETRFGNATAFGLMAAGEGGGALAGALLYGVVGHRLPRWPMYAGCFAVAGVAIALLAGSWGLAATMATLAVLGFAIAPLNPMVMTLFQERIPTESRGRVFGAILAVSNAAVPAGVLVAGYLADRAEPGRVLIGIAILMVGIVIAVLMTPTYREMDWSIWEVRIR